MSRSRNRRKTPEAEAPAEIEVQEMPARPVSLGVAYAAKEVQSLERTLSRAHVEPDENSRVIAGIKRQIAQLRKKCAWHEGRGRSSGTADHTRLKQLEDLLEEVLNG